MDGREVHRVELESGIGKMGPWGFCIGTRKRAPEATSTRERERERERVCLCDISLVLMCELCRARSV